MTSKHRCWFVLLVSVSACGGESEKGNTSPAGASGGTNSGSSGSSGNGGSAGSTAGGAGTSHVPADFPTSCLSELVAPCALEAPCVEERDPETQRPLRACSANGVVIEYQHTDSGNCYETHADASLNGALCYSAEVRRPFCRASTTYWFDAAGERVGSSWVEDSGDEGADCEGSDEASSCEAGLDCWQQPSCEIGTCPEP